MMDTLKVHHCSLSDRKMSHITLDNQTTPFTYIVGSLVNKSFCNQMLAQKRPTDGKRIWKAPADIVKLLEKLVLFICTCNQFRDQLGAITHPTHNKRLLIIEFI